MNLTEGLVAAVALSIFSSVSLQSFTSSMQVVGSSKLRDQVSVAITTDLAIIRKKANLWQVDTATIDSNDITIAGEINYTPSSTMCDDEDVALSLLEDSDQFPQEQFGALATTSSDSRRVKADIIAENSRLILSRTISSGDPSTTDPLMDKNLLKVSYTASSPILKTTTTNTYITVPARSWCNSNS